MTIQRPFVKPCRSRRHRALQLESLETRKFLATFIVSSSGDAGSGTLRQAILDANAAAGADNIEFQLASGDTKIAPLTALPKLTDPAALDARTQPGFGGQPIVELSGENLAAGETGLELNTTNSLIAGFVIHSFPGIGIHILGGSDNTIQQNYVGTDVTGQSAMPNGQAGVSLSYTTRNIVGGPNSGNLLSGNDGEGLRLYQSSWNVIQGNLVGTNADGSTAVSNMVAGVLLQENSDYNIVGTDVDDAQDAMEGNLISGNKYSGIDLRNSNLNSIGGNQIGTSLDSTSSIPNQQNGILIAEGSFGSHIGLPLEGDPNAHSRNVIAGNLERGIAIDASNATYIAGNFIGVIPTADGVAALGNLYEGIWAYNGSDGTRIGGPSAQMRNIVSGNGGAGVRLTGSRGFTIASNYIGTDLSGMMAVPNGGSGILLEDGANDGRIGGSDAPLHQTAEGNIVSGNTTMGIRLNSSSNVEISGNLIGVAADGVTPLPNSNSGVLFNDDSNNNVLGMRLAGQDETYRNVISGNGNHGVWVFDSSGNRLSGNYIGLGSDGETPAGNGAQGVFIAGNSIDTIVGAQRGSVGQNDRNVISGNFLNGVRVGESSGTIIASNYIGTDHTGMLAVENGKSGIRGESTASRLVIGTDGDATGDRYEGNLISGNDENGIILVGTPGAVISGNTVGLSSDGTALPNEFIGVFLANGTSQSLIGTDDLGDGLDLIKRNVVSGNGQAGIVLSGATTTGNRVSGNFVGTDPTGKTAIGNGRSGVRIFDGASQNTIGTNADSVADSAWRNIIAGNGYYGVEIDAASNNNVAGNYIGFALDSVDGLPNALGGIGLTGASGNRIGGNGPAEGNYVAGNAGFGIALLEESSSNILIGNSIGHTRNGLNGNADGGVLVDTSSDNQIGAKLASKNRITSNADVGVRITGDSSFGNSVVNNDIQSQSTPIDLGPEGATANDSLDDDTGPNGLQNFPVVTVASTDGNRSVFAGHIESSPDSSFEIELFYEGAFDGQRTLGYIDVLTDDSGIGHWSLETAEAPEIYSGVFATTQSSTGSQSEWSARKGVQTLLNLTTEMDSVSETVATVPVTVQRPAGTEGQLRIELEASHPGQISVPAQVILPAGQQSVVFDVTVLNDTRPEKTEDVFVYASASAAGPGVAGIAKLTIIDDDLSWHNTQMPLDVNADTFVAPNDVLLIVNYLNGDNPTDLTGLAPPRPNYFVDTNGDGFVSPIDVLIIVNHLNRPDGEGEASLDSDSVDAALSQTNWSDWQENRKKRLFAI